MRFPLLLLLALFLAAETGLAGTRPNIILIMADDLGFADLGCYGSEIDNLAPAEPARTAGLQDLRHRVAKDIDLLPEKPREPVRNKPARKSLKKRKTGSGDSTRQPENLKK